MIVSPAKLAANRANAAKSKGPTSEAGKNICRENAVKHGLSGAGVALPVGMRAKMEEMIADWLRDFPPQSAYESELVRTMALALVRMEEGDARQMQFEAVRRQELANSWDDIRADAAAALGERLETKPDRTVMQLRTTSHGCDWLQLRWECLREGLDPTYDWSDAEADQFLDLLGIAREMRMRDRRVRSLRNQIQQAKEGNNEALKTLRKLVDDQIDGLHKQADKMRQTTDVLLQNLIAGGVWFESSAEARSLRKLVHSAERQFERTWAKIKEIRKAFMLAADLGLEPERDETEGTVPQVLAIAAKTPPMPAPAPASDDSAQGHKQPTVSDLRIQLGIPFPAQNTPLHVKIADDYGVLKLAASQGLIGPERLAPFQGVDAVLALGDL